MKRWNTNDLRISELIKKNVEAEQYILERFKLLSSNIRLGRFLVYCGAWRGKFGVYGDGF